MTPNLDLGETRLILRECIAHDLLRNQAAYVLATAYHETAHTMQPVEEAFYLGAKADAHRRKLRYHPWHGRGFVQLTWEDNYRRASRELGVDLIADPSLAMEPAIAARIVVRGMKQGWFTGRDLDDYITLKRSDFVAARRIVNGTDKAAHIADIAEAYDAALKAEGFGEAAAPASHPAEAKLARIAAILAEP